MELIENGFNKLSKEVINKNLCNFCGACSFICPSNNIFLANEKANFKRNCTANCTNCYSSCPQIAKKSINKNNLEESSYYIGRTLDNTALDKVASGGAITAILTCLLEEKKVDGVIVTQFDDKIPWNPKTILTNDSLEILKAGFSKYSLTPALGILNQIAEKNYKSVAFMGLPCHVESLHLLKKMVKESPSHFNKRVIEILDSIKYSLGIWCGNNFYAKGSENFLKGLNIDLNAISEVGYEHVNSQITFFVIVNNKKYYIPFESYLGHLLSTSIADSCINCSRCYAYYGDLSIGGMNTPNLRWSGIISHSDVGLDVLNLASEKKYIELKPMPSNIIRDTKMKKIYKEQQRGFEFS